MCRWQPVKLWNVIQVFGVVGRIVAVVSELLECEIRY